MFDAHAAAVTAVVPGFRFKEVRRYSNIDVCEKIVPPVPPTRRRVSELPPAATPSQSSGIVCTNTDLLSIMNSLKSTANKALQQSASGRGAAAGSKTTDSLPALAMGAGGGGAGDRRRDVLRNSRSNSVDVANLGATAAMAAAAAGNTTRNWFRKLSTRAAAVAATAATTAVQATAGSPRTSDAECCGGVSEKRPVTIGGGGEYVVQKSPVVVTFADERPKVSLLEPVACKPEKQPVGLSSPPPPPQPPQPPPPPPSQLAAASTAATAIPAPVDKKPDVVVWDRPTGSVVNAEVLGTAIEGFLAAKKSGDSGEASPADGEQSGGGKPSATATAANEPNNRACDTSICSSLKDLFVK